MEIDWKNIRNDFPILHRQVNDQSLIYFDNAATSQKPKQVLQAINNYDETFNANVYRSVPSVLDRRSF